MTYVIQSNPFSVLPLSVPNSGHIKLEGIPTFYYSNHEYITPVNLWINHLVNYRKAKDLNSTVRALKRYFNFLEENSLSWDKFPTAKYLRPTYRFRNDNLLTNARLGQIQFSTASLYMRHVVKFYEWCIHQKFLNVNESGKPFDYEMVKIRNTGMMNHLNPHYIVSSTDLRVKVPLKERVQSLNPLSKNELEPFAKALSTFNIEFIIHQLLQVQSGLRLQEACTFPLCLALELEFSDKSEVKIGPMNGVATKYGKERKVEISPSLRALLVGYAKSKRRRLRLKKNNSSFLLVSKSGAPFSPNNVQQSFRRLRNAVERETSSLFSHTTHDLRATYCTYRLASLLEIGMQKDAVTQMMAWMGHSSEATTWKYVDFLERKKNVREAASFLDTILEESLYESI